MEQMDVQTVSRSSVRSHLDMHTNSTASGNHVHGTFQEKVKQHGAAVRNNVSKKVELPLSTISSKENFPHKSESSADKLDNSTTRNEISPVAMSDVDKSMSVHSGIEAAKSGGVTTAPPPPVGGEKPPTTRRTMVHWRVEPYRTQMENAVKMVREKGFATKLVAEKFGIPPRTLRRYVSDPGRLEAGKKKKKKATTKKKDKSASGGQGEKKKAQKRKKKKKKGKNSGARPIAPQGFYSEYMSSSLSPPLRHFETRTYSSSSFDTQDSKESDEVSTAISLISLESRAQIESAMKIQYDEANGVGTMMNGATESKKLNHSRRWTVEPYRSQMLKAIAMIKHRGMPTTRVAHECGIPPRTLRRYLNNTIKLQKMLKPKKSRRRSRKKSKENAMLDFMSLRGTMRAEDRRKRSRSRSDSKGSFTSGCEPLSSPRGMPMGWSRKRSWSFESADSNTGATSSFDTAAIAQQLLTMSPRLCPRSDDSMVPSLVPNTACQQSVYTGRPIDDKAIMHRRKRAMSWSVGDDDFTMPRIVKARSCTMEDPRVIASAFILSQIACRS